MAKNIADYAGELERLQDDGARQLLVGLGFTKERIDAWISTRPPVLPPAEGIAPPPSKARPDGA